MSRKTHFAKFTDHIVSNDGSELSAAEAERDYALHCLERELAIAHRAQARIEALEAALREIEWHDPKSPAAVVVRAVLDKDDEK